ncbi:site-2 protease family protein [Methanomicrobium mobile]|uniref:site-2 protease family protein n=1 Tax=Methanomicrobium mobile TaxID=2205 RepID=UPI0005B2E181|nr:site-2 protease family protein [Methanomicrobium mobile]
MDWLIIVLLVIAVYLLIVEYIRQRNLFPDYVMFYGPILALKTDNVKFFDRFIPYTRFFRAYGTLGALMVVVVSVLMSILMLLTLYRTAMSPPPATGIYEPQNILAIPGVNEFLPLSFAVIFAFVVTLAVHEGGHGILSRIEGMRVKSTGLLFFVIPIGAFVEPDEKDVESASRKARIRMFGAGITNNIAVALVSFIAVVLLMGLAVPADTPYVNSIYKDYPAYNAGLEPNSLIVSYNGVPISTRADLYGYLDKTKPGDIVELGTEKNGVVSYHKLTLSEWPKGSNNEYGFMGVAFYDAAQVKKIFNAMSLSPIGPIFLVYVPINTMMDGNSMGLGILAFDSPEYICWDVPFAGFWTVVQVFFWLFWLNFAVATFNALPFVPLDGGYIMKEGVQHIFEKRKYPEKYANMVVASLSWFMIMVVVMIIFIPHITHL